MTQPRELVPFQTDHAQLFDLLVSELREYVVVLMDRNGRFASWNPGVHQHLGYTADQFVGLEAKLIFTPEDVAAGVSDNEIRTATETGRAADIRWHLRRDGGRIFTDGVLIALRDADGSLMGFAKVINNLTERKLREERLEELTRALKQAQIIVRGTDGVIHFWSDGAERIYGYTEQEALERLAHELLRTEFPVPLEEIEAQLQERGVWHGELKHTRRDGQQIVVASDWILHHEGTQREAVVIEANTEVTALKRAEEDLLRANEELQHFAYASTHDLQEPLRTVRTYSQLLRRRYEGKMDAVGDEFLQTIEQSAARMELLIRDLLEYSQTGQPTLREVHVEDVVEAALLNLRQTVEESGAEITYDKLPVVWTDPAHLTVVFQNLISNAIKYRSELRPRIHVAARKTSGEWLFAVHDNGEGFENKHADQIFAVFQRLHGPDIPGTGIGLAICKRAIEREGGRIWAESEPRRGSTFYFTLPLANQTSAAGS